MIYVYTYIYIYIYIYTCITSDQMYSMRSGTVG